MKNIKEESLKEIEEVLFFLGHQNHLPFKAMELWMNYLSKKREEYFLLGPT